MNQGFGNPSAPLTVFCGNRPNDFPLHSIVGLTKETMDEIVSHNGNHWRKIFNCFAKLSFQLHPLGHHKWQDYRDHELLTSWSGEQLVVSQPDFESIDNNGNKLIKTDVDSKRDNTKADVFVIMGKTYASSLLTTSSLSWLDEYFAVVPRQRVIVCPYFDYRQLSNQRIVQLAELIKSVRNQSLNIHSYKY